MDAAAIPPLEHIYKPVAYSCVGQGLLKDGLEYDAHPRKLFHPKLSKIPKGEATYDP